MPITCCILSCTPARREQEKAYYHCFPRNYDRRQKWFKSIGMKNIKRNGKKKNNQFRTQNLRICSIHFHPSCYSYKTKLRRTLHRNAIPTMNIEKPDGATKSVDMNIDFDVSVQIKRDHDDICNENMNITTEHAAQEIKHEITPDLRSESNPLETIKPCSVVLERCDINKVLKELMEGSHSIYNIKEEVNADWTKVDCIEEEKDYCINDHAIEEYIDECNTITDAVTIGHTLEANNTAVEDFNFNTEFNLTVEIEECFDETTTSNRITDAVTIGHTLEANNTAVEDFNFNAESNLTVETENSVNAEDDKMNIMRKKLARISEIMSLKAEHAKINFQVMDYMTKEIEKDGRIKVSHHRSTPAIHKPPSSLKHLERVKVLEINDMGGPGFVACIFGSGNKYRIKQEENETDNLDLKVENKNKKIKKEHNANNIDRQSGGTVLSNKSLDDPLCVISEVYSETQDDESSRKGPKYLRTCKFCRVRFSTVFLYKNICKFCIGKGHKYANTCKICCVKFSSIYKYKTKCDNCKHKNKNCKRFCDKIQNFHTMNGISVDDVLGIQCQGCQIKYANMSTLMQHVKPDTKFNNCEERNLTETDIKNHETQRQKGQKNYDCKSCKETFTKKKYVKHLNLHRRPICDVCFRDIFAFKNSDILCNVCDKNVKKVDLKMHKFYHRQVTPTVCVNCRKKIILNFVEPVKLRKEKHLGPGLPSRRFIDIDDDDYCYNRFRSWRLH